MPDIELFF